MRYVFIFIAPATAANDSLVILDTRRNNTDVCFSHCGYLSGPFMASVSKEIVQISIQNPKQVETRKISCYLNIHICISKYCKMKCDTLNFIRQNIKCNAKI